MPKRILIIGILFCLGGILAIWEVVSDLFQSRLNLNFPAQRPAIGVDFRSDTSRILHAEKTRNLQGARSRTIDFSYISNTGKTHV